MNTYSRLQASKRLSCLPGLLMLFVAVIYTFIMLPMPLIGDDMAFSAGYTDKYGSSPIYWPYWAARHYFLSNGRISDKFNPLLFNFCPRLVLGILCGAFIFLFLFLMDKWCFPRRGHYTSSRIVLIGLVIFLFPWWDSFMLYVCHFNYIWTSAVILLFLYILLRSHLPHRGASEWLLCIFAFVAGGMHEGAGPALAGGLLTWLLISKRYKSLSRPRRRYLLAFFTGAAFVLLSPGFMRRFIGLSSHDPNDPFLILILKSDFLVLLLILTISAAWFCCRRKLISLMHSPWIIFVTAAVLSMIVSGVSGIVGRSGWFAQVFALIALYRFFLSFKPHINKWLGAIMASVVAAAVILHLSLFLYWQNIAAAQLRHAIDTFKSHPERIVYFDYRRDPDYPWYVLRRQKSVMDEDDIYYLHLTETYYGHGHKMIILPTAVGATDFRKANLPVKIGGGTVSLDTLDIPREHIQSGVRHPFPANHPVTIDGRLCMQVPFTQNGLRLLYTVPRDLEPGERP